MDTRDCARLVRDTRISEHATAAPNQEGAKEELFVRRRSRTQKLRFWSRATEEQEQKQVGERVCGIEAAVLSR